MDDFNLKNSLNKFGYKNIRANQIQNINQSKTFIQNNIPISQSSTPAQTTNSSQTFSAPQLANLARTETAAYVKDLLKLPKNINEFVYMVQRGFNQMQMNRFLSQQYVIQRANMMSPTQAQILAQLQGLSTADLETALTNQLLTSNLSTSIKNLQILSNGMISLTELSAMLQANGKDAITKLIITMANASKQGISDLSQLKETAKLINASVAVASQENTSQTLKTLLLLYLPWLPLQEGTDFDIEIQKNQSGEEEDSILVITINTLNYGRVVATLILETSNSVHVNIECSEKFPKDDLLARINQEGNNYSMQSVVSFSLLEIKSEETEQAKASVTMSSMSEINPYMLLMSHTIIRNTLMIDSEFGSS